MIRIFFCKAKFLALCFVLTSVVFAGAQYGTKTQWEAGYLIGHLFRSYSGFPNTKPLHAITISALRDQSDKHWGSYYGKVYSGLSAKWSTLGNNPVLGMEWSLLPFIEIHKANRMIYNIGLGMSYFDRPYIEGDITTNKSIGSNLTWAFRVGAYTGIWSTTKHSLAIGAVFYHASTGRLALPNYGTNSLSFNVLYRLRYDKETIKPLAKTQLTYPKSYFLYFRYGLGGQVIGKTSGPAVGSVKAVHSFIGGVGMSINRYLRLRTVLGGRQYRQYRAYFRSHPNEPLAHRPFTNSSAVFVFLGIEFLTGHVGLDTGFGIYLFKPFYQKIYNLYESGTKWNYLKQRYLASRLGLNYYLYPSNTKKKLNPFVGVHINATYDRAEFSELSIGLIKQL